ncbi:hypothetical protein FGSG_10054 [Fusarium graminearum PH-1]|uniref:hypothetical protein n=1 Tax=Gibberella zeae (strain ATCC MYA-4620 / CBS 123657 / FGSC 9075 / NRRL 31084 / PH-1) TaxID=229533 RepID=UPI00021F1787|nr:hypothetical protein FGSG_10054 [Fusarium graminearum PH-1]ESU16720.1 hypothetical protein FGSG_10054 [Fusarium graminearum PH-1]|eukprot:XP_011318982.1 hypothetical protein FGSG_10054 [Fusarium graminearum PH-1]
MQSNLLAREVGDLAPQDFSRSITSELLRSFAPAPQHRFNGERTAKPNHAVVDERAHNIKAHGAGVNSIALEKFDGRILLSGGAEGGIKVWDLEAGGNPHNVHTFRPRCALSATFGLNATIYSHSTSPVADHLIVACATQNSAVRLVDLKSGSAIQALVAHGGPVLSTAWSPRHEHILVSGHADGKARIWDIRRAGGVVALLDQEDSLGIVHKMKHLNAAGVDSSQIPHFRASAQAHDDAVNGLQWTDDGKYIISAGLDRRIRVWDAATGANTLASFGSLIQNQHAKTASILVTPSHLSTGNNFLFWPNDQEILILDLHDGNIVKRLRSPGVTNPVGPRGSEMGRNRITGIVWRSSGGSGRPVGPVMGGGNSIGAVYSSHMDGQIRAWEPQVPGPDDIAEEEEVQEDEEVKQRKRKAVDDAYKSLMGKKITFT